jgi:hypothetical protein
LYFKEFPVVKYAFNIAGTPTLLAVRDIALNVRVQREVLSNVLLFDTYDIQDGDTPERVADRIYGNPNLNWVLMLCNEKFDYTTDFPLSQDTLLEYVKQKYGAENVDAQHELFGKLHFKSPEGYTVDADYPLAEPVSNYEWEFEQNETKRSIKIINPQLIDKVVLEIQTIFQQTKL